MNRQWVFDATTYPTGVHEITVVAMDGVDLQSSETFDVKVVRDAAAAPVTTELSTTTALRVDGASPGDRAGKVVARLGDVNGDAIADYAIGAPGADRNGRTDSGSVYVVYGRSQSSGTFDLANMTSTDGFRIDGANASDFAGMALAGGAHINDDDYADLVIGAPRADGTALGGLVQRGSAYVVFGVAPNAPHPNIDLASLGTGGFRVQGPLNSPLNILGGDTPPQTFGMTIATVDTNAPIDGSLDPTNDQLDDIVIGAADQGNNLRLASGSAFIINGKSDSTTVDVAAAGFAGRRIDGANSGDQLGGSVAVLGDVDDDGLADVGLGAPGRNLPNRANAGAAYVLFSGGTGTLDLQTLGSQGFEIDGSSGDRLGASMTPAGDQTGDGNSDLAVGGNRIAFIAGKTTTTAVDLQGSFAGYRITPPANEPARMYSVVNERDANGDLLSDLVVGSVSADNGLISLDRQGQGGAWVVYGQEVGTDVDLGNLAGQRGYRITGPAAEALGTSVAAPGDVTAGQNEDALVGAPDANNAGRVDSGSAYIVPGPFRDSCTKHTPPASIAEGDGYVCDDYYGVGTNLVSDDNNPAGGATAAAVSGHDIQCTPNNGSKQSCHLDRTQYYGYRVNSRQETIGAVFVSAALTVNGPNTVFTSMSESWFNGARPSKNPPITQDLSMRCRLDVAGAADRDCPDILAIDKTIARPNIQTLKIPPPPAGQKRVQSSGYTNPSRPGDKHLVRGYYISFNFYVTALGFPNVKSKLLGGTELVDNGRFHIPNGKPVHTPRFKCPSTGCRFR